MKQFILATTVCMLVGLVSSTPTRGTVVKPGQSIQAAIDAAAPGSTIFVKAGTYAEQLLITKDGISLEGEKGTILVPPSPPIPAAKQNPCFGTAGPETIAGICVFGKDVVLEPYVAPEAQKVKSVGKRVKGVRIQKFEIRGFPGQNIALYGAEDSIVKKNTLVDGLVYGYLASGSKNTDARDNKVKSTGLTTFGMRFIAMCSDNESGATVWANDIDGYAIALCVQTNKANYQHNRITNACYGIFVDPGVDGAIVRHNTVGPTNPDCLSNFGSTSGIVLFGATNTEVEHNTVKGQSLGALATAANSGAGVAVFDAPASVASGNEVVRNDLSKNDIDILVGSTGAGNVFKKNDCTTPGTLCS